MRLALSSLSALALAASAAAGPALHVPSPDWREQIVYFVLTDRFDDGDPSNNDQGHGEYRPGSNPHYNGGDLRGVQRRLDYIQGLGATAVWVTPPVASQWWDPIASYGGYHGYWAENFMQVDRHLGALDDYRALSKDLHGRGMYLVQDIVVNHVGNFMRWDATHDPADPARGFSLNLGSRPVAAPSQWPFSLNDPRRAEDRAAAVYHWRSDIKDYGNSDQVLNGQMAGLDDLNTESPLVRRALRQSYGHWIREAGVDAYRVDTAFYVPPGFFADFLHSRDAQHPGIARVARQTGRRDFLVFGEGFALDKPGEERSARRIESYVRDERGAPLMNGMLNFPLYGSLLDVFARGRPSADLAHRIDSMMRVHRDPHRMPSFVDNHDVDRFLAGGSEAALRQALLAIMTLPGIPVVYYGTEQGFTEQRAAMFAAGVGSGGRDRFDADAPLYRYIAGVSALRRGDRVFTHGRPRVLQSDAAGPGALAWRMDHRGRSALVVFNSADRPALLDKLATGLPPGTLLQGAFGIGGRPADLRVGTDGSITLPLTARSGQVWTVSAAAAGNAPKAARSVVLDPLPVARVSGDFEVQGRVAASVDEIRLVVDGDLATAEKLRPDADGRWRARVDTASMIDPQVPHRVVAWNDRSGAVSATRVFHVDRPWKLLAEVVDPRGDDVGATGQVLYPQQPEWTRDRPGDLRTVRVFGAGGALKIEVEVPSISTLWNPPNGFDHVAFTLFIELPGEPGGADVMPLQDGRLPDGMRWHRRLRVGGWSNALFASDGASAKDEGRALGVAADIKVDRERRLISFTLPASALGSKATLSGGRLWLTTWDYDGGYRELLSAPDLNSFSAPQPAPRWIDASAVIALP